MVGAARPTISKARVWWRKNVAGQGGFGAVGQGPRTPWRGTTRKESTRPARNRDYVTTERIREGRGDRCAREHCVGTASLTARREATNKQVSACAQQDQASYCIAWAALQTVCPQVHGNAVAWFGRHVWAEGGDGKVGGRGGEVWEDQGHAHAPVCALSVLYTFCGYGAALRCVDRFVCLFIS